jgi:hypothetical protein
MKKLKADWNQGMLGNIWCRILCLLVCCPLLLYWCEAWSLILREEHRLRVFENRVLRKIFGPKRDEVAGEWRRLHREEFYDLYSSPNITWVIKSRRMRLAGHVAHMGTGEVHTGFWWGDLRERAHLKTKA